MIFYILSAAAFTIGGSQDPPATRPEAIPPTASPAPRPAGRPDLRAQAWDWVVAPQPLYPVAALQAGTPAGLARVTCREADEAGVLSSCEVVHEAPAGQGFGAAVLEVMSEGRLTPGSLERFRQNGLLTFTTQFRFPSDDPRDAQGRLPDRLTPSMRRGTNVTVFDAGMSPGVVSWEISPTPDFPDRAGNRGYERGFAIVACTQVNEARVLSRCFVVEESPPGVGFGPAVLNAVPGGRVSEEDAALVRAGRPAVFRIRFGLR